MRRRRSLTIENKILMAVVGICVLSVLCFGFLMLREGYTSKMTQEREKGEELLAYISWDIRQFGDNVGQDAILAGCAALENDGLVILNDRGARILGTEQGAALVAEGSILAEQRDNGFGWRLCYTLDEAEFQSGLVEEQKYAILATIALLIITIQVGVFVSYGISEPVRRLAAACAAIGERPQEASAELIPTDVGSAETRQLADAFRRMLEELRRYNAALAEQKALNENSVQNLPLGVVAYGADGQVLCVNDRASAMLADEAFFAAGQTLRLVLERRLTQASVPLEAIRLEDGRGDVRVYQIGVWRLGQGSLETKPGTLCTIDDVTYDKIMEEKVGEGEKLAYIGKLAAMLAHEIRKPLAGIRASIQVVGRGLGREGDRTLCASVIKEVDRINELIGDLLNLSRKRESHKAVVELKPLLGEVAMLYSKLAGNHGVTMETTAEPGLTIYADEAELKQVLINLVSNGLKAVEQGGRIALRAQGGPAEVLLSVTDDGTGMDREKLRSVEKGIVSGGTGRYGLAIVSRLLEQNGGEMKILSSPGGGTCIEMRFRRTDTEEKETL
ncbi:ATP-binding protein [Oscillibacter sp.]|uniref:sensor histidine kinase n=1 Tax=Oscillibacter sp. TaxID=1945593 RepID=UPI00289A81D9|nr:ATP-binding protein [Oscillibacter sp.]